MKCFSKITKVVLPLLLIFITNLSFSQEVNPLKEKVSMSFSQIPIQVALQRLSKQTGTTIAFNTQLKGLGSIITKKYSKKTVDYILKDLLNDFPLEYKLIGNSISIYSLEEKQKLITISGYITDNKTGEAIIGCSVFDLITKKGTHSNEFGFFSFSSVEKDTIVMVFSYYGYERYFVKLDANQNHNLKINLFPTVKDLEEVTVKANKNDRNIKSSSMSSQQLTQKEIKNIPSVGGENDVLKAITLLPGIKQGVDGSSGFYVRGGGPDQNLILLDGVPVYNPYHLWGFLSSFNSDAINNIEISKGGFPARYGGRLSSVLDITTKEGNKNKWTKNVSIGLISGKIDVSGPVIKNKSTIMVSARRTYADFIFTGIRSLNRSNEDAKVKEGYNFTDFNLKYSHRLTEKDKLLFSAFYSRDKFSYTQTNKGTIQNTEFEDLSERKQGWGNSFTSLRWTHIVSNRLFMNTTAYWSRYNYYLNSLAKRTSDNAEIIVGTENRANYSSNISDFSLKQDYQFFVNDGHTIRFGLAGIHHTFSPGVSSYFYKTGENQAVNNSSTIKVPAMEFSIYAEDDVHLTKRIKVNIGVHASGFNTDDTTYLSVQPRFSSRFLINENVSIKFAYARMTQYLHLLTSSGITQSSDIWIPSTKKIAPQQSDQFALGTSIRIKKKYLLEIEAYYKNMLNVTEYKDGVSFLDDSSWENNTAQGKGNSYGGELFLKKTSGKLTGWFGYTLSWTNRQFDDINFGKIFPYRYDRRHDVSIVMNYKINEKWSLNSSWVFYTGNAVTLPNVSYIAPNYDGTDQTGGHSFLGPNFVTSNNGSTGIVENSVERNNFRLPNYHRLDITAQYTKVKEWGEWNMTFGVINAYNKFNASFIYSQNKIDEQTGEVTTQYYQRSIFPIMPTFSFQVSF